jgi:hypothetical protein
VTRIALGYHNRGNAYVKNGEKANAEADFAETKELSPSGGPNGDPLAASVIAEPAVK